MRKLTHRLYQSVINPPSDETLNKAWEQTNGLLPVVWLLGKTGAGKSTIVQRLTGQTEAEIGTGFRPCTQSSSYYDYPTEHSMLRFLDTRGLGEASYDPTDDLRQISANSHALVIVLRISDSEQQDVISAIRRIKKEAKYLRSSEVMVVHTCLSHITKPTDRERARQYNQTQMEKAWGQALDSCAVELVVGAESDHDVEQDLEKLRALLSHKIPAIRLWLLKKSHADAEHQNFEHVRSEVLWYAGIAAASDSIPMVGAVSVPGIQGKMLHSLAQKYGIQWDKRSFAEFMGVLGLGFGARYLGSLVGRQLGKLIPIYGQSAGAVIAASISYAGTYALGRAGCSYLYHKKTNTPIPKASLKDLYQQAMQDGKENAKR